jgi:hypothetical protein
MSKFSKSIEKILEVIKTSKDQKEVSFCESVLRQYRETGHLSVRQLQAVDNAYIRMKLHPNEASHKRLTRGAYGLKLDESAKLRKE